MSHGRHVPESGVLAGADRGSPAQSAWELVAPADLRAGGGRASIFTFIQP
ncbi:MAG: hypothetical protein JWO28_2640 [Hyphomicrobiales bacterium]|nr:hypothetical protein [Hyphomicrobiales bacterium]